MDASSYSLTGMSADMALQEPRTRKSFATMWAFATLIMYLYELSTIIPQIIQRNKTTVFHSNESISNTYL